MRRWSDSSPVTPHLCSRSRPRQGFQKEGEREGGGRRAHENGQASYTSRRLGLGYVVLCHHMAPSSPIQRPEILRSRALEIVGTRERARDGERNQLNGHIWSSGGRSFWCHFLLCCPAGGLILGVRVLTRHREAY